MLRHLKMELKRQQALDEAAPKQPEQPEQQQHANTGQNQNQTRRAAGEQAGKTKRVRGRRSSKPAMEKKRRARINQCLDILKSYVLNDSNNLIQLGIDTTSRENQSEETIAKHILTSSGLINRHRGRKNTNKLEKADILELTVDYVRRLHLQRNELILNQHQNQQTISKTTTQLTNPLSLNCLATSPKQVAAAVGKSNQTSSILPSPPSSASSSPQPLLAISGNIQLLRNHNANLPTSQTTNPDVLDLSDSTKRSRLVACSAVAAGQHNQGNQQQQTPLYRGAGSQAASSLLQAQDWQNWQNPNQFYYYSQAQSI